MCSIEYHLTQELCKYHDNIAISGSNMRQRIEFQLDKVELKENCLTTTIVLECMQ
jgi:hypothetical protein